MYQLKIGTIPLPKIYVCTCRKDILECRKHGVPYLVKPQGWSDEKLVKAVLWRTLNQKFPHIKWRRILGIDKHDVNAVKVNVSTTTRCSPRIDKGYSSPEMQVTENGEYREAFGGLDVDDSFENKIEYETMKLDAYIGDLGWYVNAEELQSLGLLPEFLGDIVDVIKTNIANTLWLDGYNKKLDAPTGSWQGSSQAPNLIILDVSGSIPSGIAGTMVSLIDTLRHQANADLIVTSYRSQYWAAQDELPSPDVLSDLIGGCNECVQFYNILRTKILGKHWGNVIIFGDQDSPLRSDIENARRYTECPALELQELQSTKIDRIMAFHTHQKKIPGYGLWAKDAAPKAEIVFNTKWVNCMERR